VISFRIRRPFSDTFNEQQPGGNMLEASESVLIVIDVQERLTAVMHDRQALLANLEKLVKGMAVLKVPVMVTEQYPQGLGSTVPQIAALVSDFHPIPKMAFSCLGDKQITAALESLHRRQAIVCGIESHVCVYQTVCDLISRGYETRVVADAVSSRTPENRQIAIEMMRQCGARITSTEAILFELLKIAGSDTFREISRIVR
jgi:nicotinamidase-related amidase